MKKYLVAIWRILTTNKWMVITYRTNISIDIVCNNIDTKNCQDISLEIVDMVDETIKQEILLTQFRKN